MQNVNNVVRICCINLADHNNWQCCRNYKELYDLADNTMTCQK